MILSSPTNFPIARDESLDCLKSCSFDRTWKFAELINLINCQIKKVWNKVDKF